MRRLLVLTLLVACGDAPGPTPPLQVSPPPRVPPDAPALVILNPSEVPAVPMVGTSCPAAAPFSAVHHPGPCIILERRLGGSESLRTRRAFDVSGALVSE